MAALRSALMVSTIFDMVSKGPLKDFEEWPEYLSHCPNNQICELLHSKIANSGAFACQLMYLIVRFFPFQAPSRAVALASAPPLAGHPDAGLFRLHRGAQQRAALCCRRDILQRLPLPPLTVRPQGERFLERAGGRPVQSGSGTGFSSVVRENASGQSLPARCSSLS